MKLRCLFIFMPGETASAGTEDEEEASSWSLGQRRYNVAFGKAIRYIKGALVVGRAVWKLSVPYANSCLKVGSLKFPLAAAPGSCSRLSSGVCCLVPKSTFHRQFPLVANVQETPVVTTVFCWTVQYYR